MKCTCGSTNAEEVAVTDVYLFTPEDEENFQQWLCNNCDRTWVTEKGITPMKTVQIYIDGGCSPNPGEGGWAAILKFGATEKEIYGYTPESTNSRMELFAAIHALEALKEPCNVQIFADSQYVINGITNWIHNWVDNNWRNAQRKPVDNQDLWKQLQTAEARHTVTWTWVRGHNGNRMNERVDRLVHKARATKGQ